MVGESSEILADVLSPVHSLPGDPSSVWVASLSQRREMTAEALARLWLKNLTLGRAQGIEKSEELQTGSLNPWIRWCFPRGRGFQKGRRRDGMVGVLGT